MNKGLLVVFLTSISICMTGCGKEYDKAESDVSLVTEQSVASVEKESATVEKIENEYFVMSVPKHFLEKVTYQIDMNPDDRTIVISFYADEFKNEGGLLGGVSWLSIGTLDLSHYYSDITSFSSIFEDYVTQYSPVKFELLVLNPENTGAFCTWYPSDIQYNPQDAGDKAEYDKYVAQLKQSLLTFEAKTPAFDFVRDIADE